MYILRMFIPKLVLDTEITISSYGFTRQSKLQSCFLWLITDSKKYNIIVQSTLEYTLESNYTLTQNI